MSKDLKFFASNVVCAYLLSLSFQNKSIDYYTGCRIESQVSSWRMEQLKGQTDFTFLYCPTQT